MHLGLYEISLGGHHGVYAKAIATAAIRRAWKVTLVIPQHERNHPILRDLSPIVGSQNIIASPHYARPFLGGGKAALLAYHFKQHQAAVRSLVLLDRSCDFVYTSNLGCMDKAMLILGSPSRVPMGGMCMRVRFHMPVIEDQSFGPTAMFGELQLRRLASSKGVTCVTTADLALFDYCQGRSGALKRLKYVPEIGMEPPAISSRDARRKLGLEGSGRVILVYGALAEKKALSELLSAVATIPSSEHITVLAVGKADHWMERFLATADARQALKQGLLVLHAGFADSALEAAAFAAADAVWIAYNDRGSISGVFFQAVCSGVPIIAPNHGVIRWLTSKYRVGISVDNRNRAETGRKIHELFSDSPQLPDFGTNAKAIAGQHLPGRFGTAVCAAIGDSCLVSGFDGRRYMPSYQERRSLPMQDRGSPCG